MNSYRIALANIRIPSTPDESVALAVRGVADAAAAGARVVCFPECFVPGYRVGRAVLAPTVDEAFLQAAWDAVGDAARKANTDLDLSRATGFFASRCRPQVAIE